MYIPSMTPSHPARRASVGLITKFQCGARGAVFRDTPECATQYQYANCMADAVDVVFSQTEAFLFSIGIIVYEINTNDFVTYCSNV